MSLRSTAQPVDDETALLLFQFTCTSATVTNVHGIVQLVTSGSLKPVNAGRYVRLDRAAVEALAGRND